MTRRTLDQHISRNLTYKKRHDDSGWGLYANRDIEARESVISIQRPLVISMDIPRLKDTCYLCLGFESKTFQSPTVADLAEETKLQICTGCHVVRYCSKVGTSFPENYIRNISVDLTNEVKRCYLFPLD